MSEPCRLSVPEDLISGLSERGRNRVFEHWIPVNPEWWNRALLDRRLPGGPLQVTYDSRHRPGITRGALFELAAMTDTADAELRLLWHTLAWGGGKRLRLMSKRLDTVAADPEGAAGTLRAAAAKASSSPADAYETLYPSGRTTLKYLGPAFFTKFLYFAGRGQATHACAILDRVVAASLRSRGWHGLSSTGWAAVTYEQYCELLACWAREASTRLGRPIAVDEIERWLFDEE
jgi:hypothetical protein